MKNMKISKKLIFGFGSVIALTAILMASVITFNIRAVNNVSITDVDATLQEYLSSSVYYFSNSRVDARSLIFEQNDQTYASFEKNMQTSLDYIDLMIEHIRENPILEKFQQQVRDFRETVTNYKESITEINTSGAARGKIKNQIEIILIPELLGCCDVSFNNQISLLKAESLLETSAEDKIRRGDRITETTDVIIKANLIIENTTKMTEDASHVPELYDATHLLMDDTIDYLIEFRDSARNQTTVDGAQITIDALMRYRSALEEFYEKNQLCVEADKVAAVYGPQALNEMDILSTDISKVLNSRFDQNITETNISLLVSIILASSAIVIALIMGILITKSVVSTLRNSVENMNSVANTVSMSSRQFNEGSTQLAQGASEQAASIEETSATMNQTASMIRQTKENTIQAARLSEKSEKNASESVDKVKNLMEVMGNLDKSSNEISKIVDTINSIASQINILALNASVEAARAGDAGKSFSVVAEEVRNLSLKSTAAASDTAEIIRNNINLTSLGAESTTEVSESLNIIFSDVQKVNSLLTEISSASEEQSRGIDQINVAMSQMEKVTQSSAAIAEQSSASANEMLSSSELLSEVTAELSAML